MNIATRLKAAAGILHEGGPIPSADIEDYTQKTISVSRIVKLATRCREWARGLAVDVGVGADEITRLSADTANMKAALAGKTFFHSDEAVNLEMGKLRSELLAARAANDKEYERGMERAAEIFFQEFMFSLCPECTNVAATAIRQIQAEADTISK